MLEVWSGQLRAALAAGSSSAIRIGEEALRAWPAHPEILLLAALTALATAHPDRALALLKCFGKRFESGRSAIDCSRPRPTGHFARAHAILSNEGLTTNRAAIAWFVGDDVMEDWLY